MSLTPERQIGEKQSTRQFTNRDRLIKDFRRRLHSHDPLDSDTHRVLVHYGVGGIGKTRLRKKLGQMMDEQEREVWWATLDFEEPQYREVNSALAAARKQLRDKYDFRFPSFDVALAEYWQKAHPDKELATERLPFLPEADLASNIVEAVAEAPGVGLVAKISRCAHKLSTTARKWWETRGLEELMILSDKEPPEIKKWLPAFWSRDLQAELKRMGPDGVAIFLDTYEEVSETTDAWVREWVKHVPSALWVISSREKLQWYEKNQEWGECLSQHQVGEMADADCHRFLESCGVTDEGIREAITEASNGVPFYLDLAVDTYEKIETDGGHDLNAEDFASHRDEVVERFVDHLSREERSTLKIMSIPRRFDAELMRGLIREFETGFPVTEIDRLTDYSFIQKAVGEPIWQMHELMREELNELLDEDLAIEVDGYVFKSYADKITDTDTSVITDTHRTALTEAFHHGLRCLRVPDLCDWLLRLSNEFDYSRHYETLIPIWDSMVRIGLKFDRLDKERVYDACFRAANLYKEAGEYEKAEQLYEQAVNNCEEVYETDHPKTARIMGHLAGLYLKQGRYEAAEPLFQRALENNRDTLGWEHTDTVSHMVGLGAVYYKQGRYEEAEPLLERALEIDEQASNASEPNTSARNDLAALYIRQGDYEKAEPLLRRAIKTREETLGRDHPRTATTVANFASLFARQGRYEEAEEHYKRALEIKKQALGQDHPDTATALSGLASVYRKQGRYEEAEEHYKRALEIKKQALGPDHPDTATALNGLASVYSEQSRYEEAEPLLERALEIREQSFGRDHRRTGASMYDLASVYSEQGRYEEAESLLKRALEVGNGMLGSAHPQTAETLHKLGKVYLETGRYEKAEPLLERAVEVKEEATYPDRLDLDTVLGDLVRLYKSQGRDEEAKTVGKSVDRE